MAGGNVLADTNVLIYLIAGDRTIGEILDGKRIHVSFITEVELLSFKKLSSKEIALIEQMLKEFIVIQSDKDISRLAADLRRKYTIEVPDAIIAATCIKYELPLLTADQDLRRIGLLQHVAYTRKMRRGEP